MSRLQVITLVQVMRYWSLKSLCNLVVIPVAVTAVEREVAGNECCSRSGSGQRIPSVSKSGVFSHTLILLLRVSEEK